jgi:hypothetical protein
MKQLITVAYLCSVLSCCKSNEPVTISNYETVNTWITENMNTYYLWNDRINIAGLNKKECPDTFFKQIIVADDRHSYILNDFKPLLRKQTDNKKAGYAYFLYSINDGSVFGKITYIVAKSPAELVGLKRGMMFTKINGTTITMSNYADLASKINDHHSLTVQNVDRSEIIYDVSVDKLSENPIFLDTIYNVNSHRVGYLIYNSFTSDNGDGTKLYDLLLNEVVGRFRTGNIDELILDLRYNDEGNIFSSMILASMLIRRQDVSEIYAQYQYNKSLQASILCQFGNDHLNLHFTDQIDQYRINTVGDQIDRVIILTSPKTGTISEILINGLQPFIKVIIVGEQTVGNNFFSLFIYEDDPEKQRINTWAIIPVVMQISNKTGNRDHVFKPLIHVVEPLYDSLPLGDVRETVLSVALNAIAGLPTQSPIPSNDHIIKQISPNHLHSLSINKIPFK